MKHIAPILLVNYVKKKTGQQFKQETPVEKEGTVTIDKKPKEDKIVGDDVGEYVDYEEID